MKRLIQLGLEVEFDVGPNREIAESAQGQHTEARLGHECWAL